MGQWSGAGRRESAGLRVLCQRCRLVGLAPEVARSPGTSQPSLDTRCHGVARDLRNLAMRVSLVSTGRLFNPSPAELMSNESQYSLTAILPNCRCQLRLSHAPSLNVGRGIPTQNPQKKSPPNLFFFSSWLLNPNLTDSWRSRVLSSPRLSGPRILLRTCTPTPVDQRNHPPPPTPFRTRTLSPTELHESIVLSSDKATSAFQADSIRSALLSEP